MRTPVSCSAVDVERAKVMIERDGYKVVDVRPAAEYEGSRITKPARCSTNVPFAPNLVAAVSPSSRLASAASVLLHLSDVSRQAWRAFPWSLLRLVTQTGVLTPRLAWRRMCANAGRRRLPQPGSQADRHVCQRWHGVAASSGHAAGCRVGGRCTCFWRSRHLQPRPALVFCCCWRAGRGPVPGPLLAQRQVTRGLRLEARSDGCALLPHAGTRPPCKWRVGMRAGGRSGAPAASGVHHLANG